MSSSLTKYLLDQIKWLGYDIDIEACRISAKDQCSGELYIVSIDNGDHYTAACTLSEMVGIELQDADPATESVWVNTGPSIENSVEDITKVVKPRK